MGISSQVRKRKGSETIAQASTGRAARKRPAPKKKAWGEDIVRSAWKHAAVLEVFESGYKVVASGCWEWLGGKSHGYGTMRVRPVWGSTPVYAHRVSWVLKFGALKGGLSVLHRCDNPMCVNPQHLFAGTQQDNLRDMVQKKRHARGESNGMTKLTDLQTVEIRTSAASGTKQYLLAEQYGVSQAQISRIVRGVRRVEAKGQTRQQHGNFKHGRYSSK